MSRSTVAALLIAAGCGRIGFDASGDSPTDARGDAQPAAGKVALPQGGDVRKVIAPEGSFQRLYILSGDNHLMTSADGGATFTDCGRVPNRVLDLVGTAGGDVYAAGSAGVYESHDRCASFQNAGLDKYVASISIDGARLLAGTGDGLWRRTGTTWTQVASPTTGRLVNDTHVGAVYLALSDNGISRSTDGTTWALSNTGLQSLDVHHLDTAGGRYYVTTSDGVHVSTDAGASWLRVFDNYGETIGVDPGDPQFVAHWWYGGLIVSSDGGGTWSLDARTPPLARSYINDIQFEPNGSGRVLVATSRGLFLAADHGLAFAPVGDLDAWTVRSVARSAVTGATFYGTTTGILRETSAGFTLLDPGGPDYSAAFRVIATGDGATIHATGRALMSSTDQGDSFSSSYEPGLADGYLTIDVATNESSRLVLSTNGRAGVFDGGVWTFQTLGTARWTTQLLVTPTAILVATQLGVHASSDGGVTYALTPGLTRDTYALIQLADGSVLAGTDRGIYRATTPGGAWTLHSLDGITVTALIQVGTTVAAGDNDRVSYSTDGGATFTPVPGFTGHSPVTFAAEPDGTLLVGTSGYGLHRVHLP